MSEDQPPPWLPDGWIMEVRRGNNGSTYRYYTAPMTGYTFCTKADVLRYLISMVDGRPLETRESYEDERQLLKPPAHPLFEQLPSGWIIEIRADCTKPDKMYKCYVDPYSGSRFFSKEDVLCYLKEGSLWSPSTSNQNGQRDADSYDNVLSQLECAPEGLPDGWIKETKFRFCIEKGVLRKDPFYTDPLSGYVFRSLKNANHYIETGEISKHAGRPRKGVTEMYSFEKSADLPRFLARRLESERHYLLERHTSNSSGEVVIKKEDMSSDQTPFHCGQDGTPIWFPPRVELGARNKKIRKLVKYSITDHDETTSKRSIFEMSGLAKYSQTCADVAAQIKVKQEEKSEEEVEKSSTKIANQCEQRNGGTLFLEEEQLPLASVFKRKRGRKPKTERTNSRFCPTSTQPTGLEARPGDESVLDHQIGDVRSSNAGEVIYVEEKNVEARQCPESKEPVQLSLCDKSSPAPPHSNLVLLQCAGPDFKSHPGGDLVVEDCL